jgi:two-component system chemotaxis response regulator CheY
MFPLSTSILVVDDSEVMVSLIKGLLSHLGYKKVATARHGKAALEKIEESQTKGCPIELLLVDWTMPEMSGIELLERIRERPEGRSMTFIMVTAQSTKAEVIDAIHKGANGYILKPFTGASVSESLSRAWQMQQKKAA